MELINIVYIFVGVLMYDGDTLKYVDGTLIVLIGIAYVVLEFMPSVEPPSNMRENDAGWGAEQV